MPPAADGREGPDSAGIIGVASRKPSSSCYRYLRSAPAVTRSGAGDDIRFYGARFVPSPTGYLHLGHVRSALEGWRAARGDGGRFLLRFEDIDKTRCRDEYAAAILEDLVWLGLSWDGPVRRQSEHFDDYRRAPDRLEAMAVLYPCICTRREIRDEIARASGAPHAAIRTALSGDMP
jgi:glutamyl/glutaminyl-tRNA synthetase